MPEYSYRAQDASGKTVRGKREADDELELHLALKNEGLALLSATEPRSSLKTARELKSQALAAFCLKVSELLAAGVPLIRTLTIVSEEESIKPAEAAVYSGLITSIKKGSQLSQAMDEARGAFPALLVNMVASAEQAGNLAEVFRRMSTHYEKEHRFNAKIHAATLYPKILSVLIVVVVAIIVGFVLPQFQDMFDKMGELPLPTVILLGISGFVSTYWLQLIVAVIAVVLLWMFLSRVPAVRLQIDRIKLKLPVVGKQNRTVATARFARTFSSLYNSGINAITALEIASNTIGNAYIQSQFGDVIDMVRTGHTLSEAFGTVDGFISKFVASVRVGEESGSLEDMLTSTADTLDFEAEQAMQRMVGYLEPAMIVLMAIIVGFVIIAVIVPIYNSYSTIGAGTTSY